MKIIKEINKSIINKNISQSAFFDYIYMYPPRQSYYDLKSYDVDFLITKSLKKFNDVNIYFHIPFCNQTCSYCNIYTIPHNSNIYNCYINALKNEFLIYTDALSSRRVKTIYFGGGTPSLLNVKYIDELLITVRKFLGIDLLSVDEISLEVSPETISFDKFVNYKNIGINRVNIGLQTHNNVELKAINRAYNSKINKDAIEIIKKIGFKNVCIDLIYGLKNQSFLSWKYSLEMVLDYSPETICIYPLTLRPSTIFDIMGYNEINGKEQYIKYDYAREKLLKEGYRQETHVRFIKNEKGGYLQKENHWKMQNILGFGAGARSYLWECDTRNGYSLKNRKKVLNEYVLNIRNYSSPITDGFLMTDDERMRKAVILGLFDLDCDWFNSLFGINLMSYFEYEFNVLFSMKLINELDDKIFLTDKGIRHRDLIVQLFFSEKVKKIVSDYKYDD